MEFKDPKAHIEEKEASYQRDIYKFKERVQINDEAIHHDHEVKMEDHAEFLRTSANAFKEKY